MSKDAEVVSAEPPRTRLARRLGTGDAVVLGLGSMVGAGVFVAIAPGRRGRRGARPRPRDCRPRRLLQLSSARLAARDPESGGTYVYGRRRLGELWGYLAGWGFVVGEPASCAAMALTFGHYIAPLAPAAVLGLTAVNLRGIGKTIGVTKAIVAVVLLWFSRSSSPAPGSPERSRPGISPR